MGPTKRSGRAASVPPPKAAGKRKLSGAEASPAGKKAKVQDPVAIAMDTVCQAITFDLHNELPPKVVTIVASITPSALSSTVEERDALETEFAKLVGTSLKMAHTSLTAKAAVTAAALAENDAMVSTNTTALEQANVVKADCDGAVAAATTAEKEAKDAKNAAIVAFNDQKEAESKLDATKQQHEEERTTLQWALDTTRGEPPSAKDSKKLATLLQQVGAPEALHKGAPSAVGKESDFEKMIIDQASKLLEGKIAEVQGKQNDHGKIVAEMAAKTQAMEAQVNALTEAFEQRKTGLTDGKTKQKAAAQGIKDAEASLRSSQKAAGAAKTANDDADKEVATAVGAYSAFEFLYTRSSAPAEPEAADAPMEAAA